MRPEAQATRSLCTFIVGGMHFGVDVLSVQEVIRYHEMTAVPLAAPVVSGLINLRGQIVMALDMRKRLDLPHRKPDEIPMNVVLRTDDGPVSLLVDEIGDVVEPPDDALEEPPNTIEGTARDLVTSVLKLREHLLLLLNVGRTVDIERIEAKG